MRNVTDRTSNPFGMRAPRLVENGTRDAVYGYGDANADFHVVGHHPGVHGGVETGVPFTGTEAGRRLQSVLTDVGLVETPDEEAPAVSDLFASYLHMSVTEDGRAPTDDEYARLEPFFDAELRAIGAHVLLPVGERATRHVLEQHTAKAHKVDPADAHARQIRGRGVLVVPAAEPVDWGSGDADALRETIADVLETGYRQEVDLGRFWPNQEPYTVR